ncbi:MAG: DNA repair protein RecN [Desulfatibacillaceae bacterium]|nr:DNA repair protein RecN [Desulfatibacillaceae bacterium]
MLAELSIKNFAIIDDLAVRFDRGFTVITGETGAGKSILVNAVNLILGARASSKMVRTGADFAELSAMFLPPKNSPLAQKLAQMGFDPAEGLVIVRIISSTDRHRISINNRPATMTMLAELTGRLASISGQHAHQSLLAPDEHLLLLDGFSGLMDLRARVAVLFADAQKARARLNELKQKKESMARQRELAAFQKDEIQKAAIRLNEDTELAAQRTKLKNATALFEAASACEAALYSEPGAAVEILGVASSRLTEAARLDEALSPLASRIERLVHEAEDVAFELRSYRDSIEYDEARLEDVEARLHLLAGLKKKYGGSLEAVLAHEKSLDGQLEQLENLTDLLADAQKKADEAVKALFEAARLLSQKRREAAPAFEKAVAGQLDGLGMKGTRFAIEFDPVEAQGRGEGVFCSNSLAVDALGCERAAFMIAPNVGEALKPLREIASGGELSRVVLAIRAMLAKNDEISTIVFDEVDAGIGGAVADAVAEKLAALAKTHQVLCITHLPQIAAKGQHHFNIEKQVKAGRTQAFIRALSGQDRVRELARMLAGDRLTEKALAHASEMLG